VALQVTVKEIYGPITVDRVAVRPNTTPAQEKVCAMLSLSAACVTSHTGQPAGRKTCELSALPVFVRAFSLPLSRGM